MYSLGIINIYTKFKWGATSMATGQMSSECLSFTGTQQIVFWLVHESNLLTGFFFSFSFLPAFSWWKVLTLCPDFKWWTDQRTTTASWKTICPKKFFFFSFIQVNNTNVLHNYVCEHMHIHTFAQKHCALLHTITSFGDRAGQKVTNVTVKSVCLGYEHINQRFCMSVNKCGCAFMFLLCMFFVWIHAWAYGMLVGVCRSVCAGV